MQQNFKRKFNIEANFLDSPGIISLVPNSPDEQVTVDSLYSSPNFWKPKTNCCNCRCQSIITTSFISKQLLNSNFNVIVASYNVRYSE